MPSIRPNARKNRQRQLEGLQRMEQRIQQLKAQPTVNRHAINKVNTESSLHSSTARMQLFALDISEVLEHGMATWLPQRQISQGPEEIILYTLVAGRAEIIMFGGIQKDKNTRQPNAEGNIPDLVSNVLHIISAKKQVI